MTMTSLSDPIAQEMYASIAACDNRAMRKILQSNPGLMPFGCVWMFQAASAGNLDAVKFFYESGIDVNAPRFEFDASTPIFAAAENGRLDVARWLLEHGARVDMAGNYGYALEAAAGFDCPEMTLLLLSSGADPDAGNPLAAAATAGCVENVRLLLKHGADPNVIYGENEFGDPPRNALLQAESFGHEEVAKLLREYGAILPSATPTKPDELEAHISEYLGIPSPVSLQDIVPQSPPISVLAVELDWGIALVTKGMSAKRMTVPAGAEEYAHAELIIYLPRDWPLSKSALRSRKNSWPVDWLKKIAIYPHEHKTWMGGPTAIVSNGEPPKEFCRGTNLSCIFAVTEGGDFGRAGLSDGRNVVFYTLLPIYAEERELERAEGAERLLQLFSKHRVAKTVAPNRKNVALLAD